MLTLLFASALSLLPVPEKAQGAASASARDFDIRAFGAVESDLLQTPAIQAAIDAAAKAGGGTVTVPEGCYRTGGLVLRSGVTLRLADGAVLKGDFDPENYPGTNRWYRALVRADGARDVGIVGGRHSCIDGSNVFDPRGEENYRGPHALMFIGCTNVTLRGYTVRDSANWAHAIFRCADVRLSDVRVFGGHDAVDFHASTDVTVERCELRTGDDCVAGFANYRCRIRDCILDSSCQAVRIGGADILFERCRVVHPSSFGHRYGLSPELKRAGVTAGEGCKHGIYAGVIYYCDARWTIDRPQRDIVFRDCVFDRPRQIFSFDYDGRNMWCCRHPLESIAFERCTFTGVEKPIAIYGDEARPLDFTLRDCKVVAAPGCGEAELLSAYNFGRLTLENVTLEGFAAPHLVTRSKGEVVVKGGTGVRNVFRPDPNDRTLTFAEAAEALAKQPGDDAAYAQWEAAHPTPSAARWSAEKRLYVTDDPLVEDVWGSALAVLRGETPHAAAIARRLCASYQYYVGWGRTGAVKPNHDGELSPLAAGAFGYAMAQDDPLFARTFFTDFVRSDRKTPAAVSGVRLALKKLLGADDVTICRGPRSLLDIPKTPTATRNSEGDVIATRDGRLLMAYTLYTGKTAD